MRPINLGNPLLLLAQDFDSPLIKYFSYIALGLMLSIGWVVYRVFSGKEKGAEEARNRTEEFLAQAEADARRLKQKRSIRPPAPEPPEEEVLTLSPEQQAKLEGLKRLVQESKPAEEHPGDGKAAEGLPEDQGDKRRTVS